MMDGWIDCDLKDRWVGGLKDGLKDNGAMDGSMGEEYGWGAVLFTDQNTNWCIVGAQDTVPGWMERHMGDWPSLP